MQHNHMGTILFTISTDTDSNSKTNQALARKLIGLLEQIPEGKQLLSDVTRNSDITINLVASLIQGKAHWDTEKRAINIQFFYDSSRLLSDSEEDTEIQNDFISTVVFELCNAANPLLAKQTHPLAYSSSEEYTREQEFREFVSYRRRAKLINEAIAQLGWKFEKELIFAENEFDKYYSEISNKEHAEIYGKQKSHANYYRNAFDHAYKLIHRNILEIMNQFVQFDSLSLMPL